MNVFIESLFDLLFDCLVSCMDKGKFVARSVLVVYTWELES